MRLALVSACAPHFGYAFGDRQKFFEDLRDMISQTSVNKLKLVLGDSNARILKQLLGGESYVVAHIFVNAAAELQLGSKSELLLESCVASCMSVANTFFDVAPEAWVTFRNAGVKPMNAICTNKLSQLGLGLVPHHQLQLVKGRFQSPRGGVSFLTFVVSFVIEGQGRRR